MSPRVRIAIAAVLFSTGGAAIKAAALSPWQVASFRSGIAALTLLMLAPRVRHHLGWRAALVGAAYAATLITFVLANRMTTAASTIFLQSTAPLYVIVLGPWLLREPVRRHDLPVLFAVAVGLALVFAGGSHPTGTAPDPLRGNVLAAISGFCCALLLCGLRWLGRGAARDDHALAAVTLGNVITCLVALPLALPVGIHPTSAWVIVTYLGVFQIAGAYLLVTSGLRFVTALDTALLLLIETALNPLWAWLLLAEAPAALAVGGGACVVAATITQSLRAGDRVEPLEAM
jgi:drug/metabolite transporter, DME family